MAVWRFVDFCVKETQKLADLTGIAADLQATENICDLVLSNSAKQPQDFMLLEALCAAAIIRYGRSFGSGVRYSVSDRIKNIINALPKISQEFHEYFDDLRDRWIAHSINAFEENIVHAYLTPEERGPRGISSISVQHQRVATLDIDHIRILRALAAEIRGKIDVLIEEEKKTALEYARSLPADDFYIQVDDPLSGPGGDPKKRRKAF
jgi:hypothetical protein